MVFEPKFFRLLYPLLNKLILNSSENISILSNTQSFSLQELIQQKNKLQQLFLETVFANATKIFEALNLTMVSSFKTP